MKQQSAAAPVGAAPVAAAPVADAPSESAVPAQNTVGNASLAKSVKPPAAEPSPFDAMGGLEGDAALASTEPTKEAAKRGPAKKAGAAAGAPTGTVEGDPVSRPALVKKGAKGALIGAGDVSLLSSPEAGASAVATVPNGTPCKVTDTKETWIKVQARAGKEKKEGWVAAATFSDQPGMAKDEDDPSLFQDQVYSDFGKGQLPGADPKKEVAAQGALGDCFLVSSIAAVTFANPDFMKGVVRWDDKKKRYVVKFHQEISKGKFVPVEIEVDGFLPTERGARNDPSFAGDPGQPQWGAIIEKAYAKWKGGYDVLDEGGTGEEAMAAITGIKSVAKDPGSMEEKDVVPYFKEAKKNGLAVYAGVVNSVKAVDQQPFKGSGSGPYTASVAQSHEWNEIQPGSVSITDKSGKVAEAWDEGEEDAKEGPIDGDDVKSGKVQYKDNKVEVTYDKGKAPKAPGDLNLGFEAHGVVLPAKTLIGNHAYVFQDVVNGKMLQFYNPWGSYQPKPITAAEFLQFFDALATNAVPGGKKGK